jgi:hypothetical protein
LFAGALAMLAVAAVWRDRDERPTVPTAVPTAAPVVAEAQTSPIAAPVVLARSGRVHTDLFSTAPKDWRVAGAAIAEVANRWQCDSRWSFFSLKNDRREGKAAALWNKYLYPGDVALEFFVANKMEGERGVPYTYARDINVTICSDGADLRKGYTFLWGGHGNKDSVILRNSVEVRRCDARIPTDMTYHNRWFTYRVEKVGGRLSFRVVGLGHTLAELAYEDPQPIEGDHIAIWTYDHAVMLARVLLSGDGGAATESPDFQPGPLKTPYDDK